MIPQRNESVCGVQAENALNALGAHNQFCSIQHPRSRRHRRRPRGLAASILLASGGMHVRVLERLPIIGGRTFTIEANGFKFDLEPTFFLYPRVLDEIFRAVGTSLAAEVERAGFVIAWPAGMPVGCGAWRPISEAEPGVVEIKRMYVEPALRRRGIARAILNELERLAQADGYSVARLETGTKQPAAIRLYETSGYYRIEPFGRYRDDPLSVCYEKRL
jgi:putative acetyltransferase